jgi:schlafen family protein
MAPQLHDLLGRSEAEDFDRKSSLDPTFAQDYLKLAADLIAMANTRGGAILIGTSGCDIPISHVLLFDSARIDDKVNSVVDPRVGGIKSCQLGEAFILVEIEKSQNPPHLFKQDGNCTDRQGKSASVFRRGDAFVRHSSKTERAARTDFDRWFDSRQKKLLDNVKLVFEASPDAEVQISKGSTGMPVRIAPEEPDAQPVYDLLTPNAFRDLKQELTGSLKAWKTSRQTLNEAQIYKAYAERGDVDDSEAIGLLLRSGWERYMPGFYWASKLNAASLIKIIREVLESDAYPASQEALKVAALLPREHARSLFRIVETSYKKNLKKAVRKFDPVLRARARKCEVLVAAIAPSQKLTYTSGEGIKEVKAEAVTEGTFDEILKSLLVGQKENRGVFKAAELLVFGPALGLVDFSAITQPDAGPNVVPASRTETDPNS